MGDENQKGAPADPGAFQKVLETLNQGGKIRALEIARKHGIPDDDPVWHVVLTIAEAEEGFKEVTKSLREASASVIEATNAEVKKSQNMAVGKIDELKEKSIIEINGMKEKAKGDFAEALGKTLTTEIGKAVNALKSQNNRPLHKNWLIAASVVLLVGIVSGGWGFWDFYKYAENVGEVKTASAYASPMFQHFLKCDRPGWRIEKDSNGSPTCFAYKDSETNTRWGWSVPIPGLAGDPNPAVLPPVAR